MPCRSVRLARPLLSSLALASAFVTTSAFADDAPAEPLPAPAQVTPAPGQAAAAAPSPAAIPVTATCSLGEHHGIDEVEARTGADVVCNELARLGATNTQHEVRFGKLGGKVLVAVATRNGNAYDERRTLLVGMDELPVAAPRLASALSENRPLDDTKNVDNVLGTEARAPKTEKGQMGFELGLFGMSGTHEDAGAAGGVHMGLVYRAGNFGVTSHGRAGGIGSAEAKLATASIDIGGRYYFSNAETAVFVGTGLGLDYFNLVKGPGRDGSGLAAFGEVGVDFLRTHHAALGTSLRADVPFFSLDGAYVVPLSLNVSVAFH